MRIHQYPALNDNYNWIVICKETKKCAGVDIYNTNAFFQYIAEHDLKPVAILNTHHHHDHTGGNQKIFEKYPEIKIYGSVYDIKHNRITHQNHALSEGDTVRVGNLIFNVLEIPGHTLGHICYYNEKAAFVGDTLFASGCGRLFEGTPEQMYDSLEKLLKYLKPLTPIYCGHEYTESNLKFASSINENYFSDYLKEITELRRNDKMTVPTDMHTELKYNPFLMVREENYRHEILNLRLDNPVKAFALLRQRKDNF